MTQTTVITERIYKELKPLLAKDIAGVVDSAITNQSLVGFEFVGLADGDTLYYDVSDSNWKNTSVLGVFPSTGIVDINYAADDEVTLKLRSQENDQDIISAVKIYGYNRVPAEVQAAEWRVSWQSVPSFESENSNMEWWLTVDGIMEKSLQLWNPAGDGLLELFSKIQNVDSLVGRFHFSGYNDASDYTRYAFIGGGILDKTDGTEDGFITLGMIENGVDDEQAFIKILQSEFQFQQASSITTTAGDLTLSPAGNLVISSAVQYDGAVIIDVDSAEALLVRKDGDAGDVFTVNTSDGVIGIGSAPIADRMLRIDNTWNSSSTIYGFTVQNNNTGTGTNYGLSFESAAGGSASIGTVTGLFGGIKAYGSANITVARGIDVRVQNTGSGTITSGYGAWISSAVNSGGGAITKLYGIRIDGVTLGSSSNYSLYTEEGTVSFGDDAEFRQAATLSTTSGNLELDPASLLTFSKGLSANWDAGAYVITTAGMIVDTSAGYDVTPGSDTDTDLITLNVTGAPTLSWDESADRYLSTHGLRIAANTIISSTDVAPDGGLHIHTATAGTVAANAGADELVLENSAGAGLSVLVPDASTGKFVMGSPTANVGFQFTWRYSTGVSTFETNKSNARMEFYASSTVKVLTLRANDARIEYPVLIQERSSAVADVAGYGQLWVKDDAPNVPMFTDDAGTDHQLAYV